MRIRKYAANTQFTADRARRSGFEPAHALRDALVATIRHEFAPHRRAPAQPTTPQTAAPPAELRR